MFMSAHKLVCMSACTRLKMHGCGRAKQQSFKELNAELFQPHLPGWASPSNHAITVQTLHSTHAPMPSPILHIALGCSGAVLFSGEAQSCHEAKHAAGPVYT